MNSYDQLLDTQVQVLATTYWFLQIWILIVMALSVWGLYKVIKNMITPKKKDGA